MATVEMSFTPLPVHVRTARLVATAVARRSGVQEALLDEVRLAVGEACSRAVEAHRAHCPAEPVRIELTGTDGRFEVVVIDAAARDDEYLGTVTGPGSGNGLPGPGNGLPGGGLPRDSLTGEAPPGGGLPGEAVPAGGFPGEALPGEAVPAGGFPGEALPGGGLPAEDSPDNPEALLPQGLGLAVIAGLADDVKIIRTAAGLSIRMSWPSGEYAG
jgi:anti-sigma regulatory factor (Ser/Thr protein kinase)